MYCWVSGLIHSAHQSLSGIWLPSFLHSVCSSDNCVGLGHDSMDVHCPFLASDGSWVDRRSLGASPSKPWWRDRRPSAWCLSLLTVICLRPLCSGCSEGCDLSRWAHNQCESICMLVDLLFGELWWIMALSQFWVPHTSQGLLLHQAMPLLPKQSTRKIEPSKTSASPSCLPFPLLPTPHS